MTHGKYICIIIGDEFFPISKLFRTSVFLSFFIYHVGLSEGSVNTIDFMPTLQLKKNQK